jgi:hypothetical protein
MSTEHNVNAQPHPQPKEVAAHAATAASPCWVSEHPVSAPITAVKQSTFTNNFLYWLNFNNSKTVHTLDFVVTFKAGSPLTTQRQHFSFPGAGYGGSTSTPFGVPFWGGNPILGPATLAVLADGVPAGSYNFKVVA